MKTIILCILLFNYLGCTKSRKIEHAINEEYYTCEVQNDDVINLGIGIAEWNYECDTNIVIYGDSILSRKIFDINVCDNSSSSVCPLFYKPDYGIYHFIVTKVSKSRKWYEIIYNGDKKGYISTNLNFSFKDWHTFLLKNTTGIRVKGQDTVYVVQAEKDNIVTALNEENKKIKNIKWRDNNKLKIEIFLLE